MTSRNDQIFFCIKLINGDLCTIWLRNMSIYSPSYEFLKVKNNEGIQPTEARLFIIGCNNNLNQAYLKIHFDLEIGSLCNLRLKL